MPAGPGAKPFGGENKAPTRDNSVVSLTSTRTGDTQTTQLATSRTATTARSGRRSIDVGSQASSKLQNGKMSKRDANRYEMDEDREEVQDFDIGTFYNFAEWYGDDPYMTMALRLFEKSPAGCILKTQTMGQVLQRLYKETREADPTELDDRDKLVTTQVIFTLPELNDQGNFTWDKVSYRLPVARDKKAREARLNLLRFLDGGNKGRMSIGDLKLGFSRVVTMPGLADSEPMLDEVIRRAQAAVEELSLDGAPRHNDDIITKEFRVFLMFLQGYMDLWEMFVEQDGSGDEMVMLSEFVRCAPKLKEWGLKDPALLKNPAHVFSQIDKDESGYVTFGEFADFCVRRGLMEEIAQELKGTIS